MTGLPGGRPSPGRVRDKEVFRQDPSGGEGSDTGTDNEDKEVNGEESAGYHPSLHVEVGESRRSRSGVVWDRKRMHRRDS